MTSTASRQAGYDRCRGVNHAWYDIDADRNPSFGYPMWLKCDSCGTIRKDIVDRHGNVLDRQYDYPPDYKDSEGHSKADFRARLIAPRINGFRDDPIEPIKRDQVSDSTFREYLHEARSLARVPKSA